MSYKIEDVTNPIIGEYYLVNCVVARRPGQRTKYIFPVVGHKHSDAGFALAENHYHVDWRFAPQYMMDGQNELFKRVDYLAGVDHKYLFTPVTEKEIVKDKFRLPLRYMRHFDPFPQGHFKEIEEHWKDATMKDMICPHKGTNLHSCQVIDGIVTCPAHGLRWNVSTGKMIKS